MIKKPFQSYTSRWIPEGTDSMFISYKTFTTKCWWSRRLSQAAPPGGYLKAQIACSFHAKLFTTKCWCSRRLSQATPPGGYLKAQIACSFHEGFYNKMLVIKKTFPSYTPRWLPEGTDSMFISYKAFTTKCWWSRRLSQATPPGGYLKAQIACSFHTRLFTTKCWWSRRLSQATPPGGYLKAQIACSFHEGFYYKMLVIKKTFPSYTSRWIPEGTDSMFISYKAFTTNCWWSRRLSQATPPGGYLKVQIACSFHTRLLLQNVGDQEDFPKLHLQIYTWRHR